MAISDYSTTPASNTSISGIDISGATGKVKDGDNAIRQMMADLATYYASVQAIPAGAGTFRNKIINGDFDIWQRATSQTSSGYGSDDRWSNSATGSTKTHSQQTHTVGQTTVVGNPKYFSRTVVTSSAGSSNQVSKFQRIEGAQTLQGKTATITFYAKADASKNIAVELAQVFGTGGSPSSTVTAIGVTTCALTTSWQKFSFTVSVPSISGKTLGSNGDDSLQLVFWFDAGSDYNSRTNSLGQQSGTFDISHVSLVEGAATSETDPFSRRHAGAEIALCQRYFLNIIAGSSTTPLCSGYMASSTSFRGRFLTPVAMRAAPTLTLAGSPLVAANGSTTTSLSSITTALNPSGLVDVTITTGALTANHTAALASSSGATLECEL